MDSKQTVCVAVVTHNRYALLEQCLLAIQAQTVAPSRVFVIDNASTDQTAERIRSKFPSIEIVTLERNMGHAGGFSIALKKGYCSNCDYIWFLVDDAVPENNALEELLKVAEKFPKARILASRLFKPDGTLDPMAGLPDFRRLITWLKVYPELKPLRWAPSTSLLIHRSAIEQHGFPCEKYFIWEDDLEYTGRILKHSWGFEVARSRVTHVLGSPPFLTPQRVYYSVRNRIWVVRSSAFGIAGKAFYSVHLLFGIVYALFRQPSKEVLSGILRGLKDGLLENPC